MSPALPKEDTDSLSRLYLIRVIIIFRLYSVLPRPVVNKRGCNLLIEMHYFGIGGGGGTPGNSWLGCAAWFSKSWPYFRLWKTVIFHTRFQTRPLKSIPVSRPVLQAEIMLALLSLERKQNYSSNPIRIRKFLFLSYSFGIETINTFIHFRKCPRRKPYPFSDQNSTKTLPDGVAHTCILAYIGEYPPGLEGWRFEKEDNMHLSFQISCRFFKDMVL